MVSASVPTAVPDVGQAVVVEDAVVQLVEVVHEDLVVPLDESVHAV